MEAFASQFNNHSAAAEMVMATGAIKHNPLENVTSIESAQNGTGVYFTFDNGKTFKMYVGKLDASNNYVQFEVNGVDKGYIKFTVSRNI